MTSTWWVGLVAPWLALATGTPDRFKADAAVLPVDAWVADVGDGCVLVVAEAVADDDGRLSGQLKRAAAAALREAGVKVQTGPMQETKAAVATPRQRGCTHVLLARAEPDEEGEAPPGALFRLLDRAGRKVRSSRLERAFAPAPLMAVTPHLSDEKLKRDAATAVFPKHAVKVLFITTYYDNLPTIQRVELQHPRIRAESFGLFVAPGLDTRILCNMVPDLPRASVKDVCDGKRQKASHEWSYSSRMPERAVQLLVLTEAFNRKVAETLGADTLEFGAEYFPVSEVVELQDAEKKKERDRQKAQRKRERREAEEEDEDAGE